MRLPKMTAKRWFWTLLSAGLVWSFAGWRWDGQRVGTLASIQERVTAIPRVVLIPPSFILSNVQSRAQGAFDQYAADQGTESAEELRQKVRALQNENVQLKNTIAAYEREFTALKY